MSIIFNLHNCPFCQTELINSTVHCPENKKYSCLECPKCNSYFFTKNNYKILYNLAEKKNRKLNSNVHYYDTQASIWNKTPMQKLYDKKKTTNKKTIVKSKQNTKSKKKQIANQVIHNKILARIKFGHANDCTYYENMYCILIKDECDPSSSKCNFLDRFINNNSLEREDLKNKADVLVKAIVLSHNHKCIYEEHHLTTIKAIIKVLITSSNKVIDVKIPATYCEECDQYIILKSDFKYVKQQGTLLCQVIDKTPEYLTKHKNSYTATESKVHSLGYNVIKQGYNYTFEQRKIILANIIENYGITQHEILSMLDTNISRKINLPNYAEAVNKWQQDREFVANYKLGDCHEVIINEIVVGRR